MDPKGSAWGTSTMSAGFSPLFESVKGTSVLVIPTPCLSPFPASKSPNTSAVNTWGHKERAIPGSHPSPGQRQEERGRASRQVSRLQGHWLVCELLLPLYAVVLTIVDWSAPLSISPAFLPSLECNFQALARVWAVGAWASVEPSCLPSPRHSVEASKLAACFSSFTSLLLWREQVPALALLNTHNSLLAHGPPHHFPAKLI